MTLTASRLFFLGLPMAAALAVAACSRGEPEPEQNVAATEPAGTTVEIPEVAEPAIPAEPSPPADNMTAEEEPVPAEVQMQEDADATGMTSRLPPPTEDQAPVATE